MPNDEKLVTDEMIEAGLRVALGASDFATLPELMTNVYLAMRPLDPEWVRMLEALTNIANAVRLGAETDLFAWANLANACQETARAALNSEVNHGPPETNHE